MLWTPRGVGLWLAAPAMILAGCNAVFGVSDLGYETAASASASSGGGASSSASSNAGGASTTSSAAGGAGGSGGQGGTGGGAMTVACSTVESLADDFTDGTRDIVWSANSIPVEAGGVLSMTPGNTGDPNVIGYRSRQRYDLTNSSATVEVLQVADGDGSSTSLILHNTGSTDFEIEHRHGNLRMEIELDGTGDTTTVPYDPVAHRWWRIRETNGIVYWEASPNGTDWVELRQAPTAGTFPIDQIEVRLRTETTGSTSPGTAVMDNFNYGVASAPLCKAHTVQRDFDDGQSIPSGFIVNVANCSYAAAGGQFSLAFDASATAGDNCALRSNTLFDLTGSSITVEIPKALSANGNSTWLGINDAGAFASVPDINFEIIDGDLRVTRWVDAGSVVLTAVPYQAANHRWLRLREEGGDLIAEASPNALDWTEIYAGDAGVDLTEVVIELGIWAGNAGLIDTAEFDNLNVLP